VTISRGDISFGLAERALNVNPVRIMGIGANITLGVSQTSFTTVAGKLRRLQVEGVRG
jgi:hypothetical protein